MKPTDGATTINANLINGTELDKYNFKWSQDVYDVVDLQYSANVCTVRPKQTGSVTVTISHPKAAYPQQVIINVQQYSEFQFPSTNYTMTQGDVKFLNMEVPMTTVTTKVMYSVDNANICTITGTNSTAQIQAIKEGTTVVHAKLVAVSTGLEQASSDMMIYVKKKDISATYITATTTIYTVEIGKSIQVSALLSGQNVDSTDNYKLKWKTSDTDIIGITGIKTDGTVEGQNIYITAKAGGEAIITCSHPKAASELQIFVVVPGAEAKIVSLNKTAMRLTIGSIDGDLTASISNSTSQDDYNKLEWKITKIVDLYDATKILYTYTPDNPLPVDDAEVVRIMGYGKKVTIHPIKPGIATVQVSIGASSALCDITVEAANTLVFDKTMVRIRPGRNTTINYTVSPPNSVITWTFNKDGVANYIDNGRGESKSKGSITVSGLNLADTSAGNTAEQTVVLTGVTERNAKAVMTITVAWDYMFAVYDKDDMNLDSISVNHDGDDIADSATKYFYRVSPENANIRLICETNGDSKFGSYFDEELAKPKQTRIDGTVQYGEFTIKPLSETPEGTQLKIRVVATNPVSHNDLVGERVIQAKFRYKRHTPVLDFTRTAGVFSNYQNGDTPILTLGDGESVHIVASIKEKNSSEIVTGVKFTNTYTGTIEKGSPSKVKMNDFGGTSKNYTIDIISEDDFVEKVYFINSAHIPMYMRNYDRATLINALQKDYWIKDEDNKYDDGEDPKYLCLCSPLSGGGPSTNNIYIWNSRNAPSATNCGIYYGWGYDGGDHHMNNKAMPYFYAPGGSGNYNQSKWEYLNEERLEAYPYKDARDYRGMKTVDAKVLENTEMSIKDFENIPMFFWPGNANALGQCKWRGGYDEGRFEISPMYPRKNRKATWCINRETDRQSVHDGIYVDETFGPSRDDSIQEEMTIGNITCTLKEMENDIRIPVKYEVRKCNLNHEYPTE